MLKERNKDIRSNQTGQLTKRRDLGFKKRTQLKRQEGVSTLDKQKQLMKEAQKQTWESYQITSAKSLSKEDRIKRQKILVYLLRDVRPCLKLKLRTIEHTIKMLDIYESRRQVQLQATRSKSGSRKAAVYSDHEKLLLDLITCLHLSCKYNEIYPPVLSQITNLVDCRYQLDIILDNELTVLTALDLNLNVALVSDWHKITNSQIMPAWAYLCYLDFDLKDKSKQVAEELNRFIQKINKSTQRETFQILSKNSDFAFNQSCSKLYNTFVQFRVKNQISKLALLTEDQLQSLNSSTNKG